MQDELEKIDIIRERMGISYREAQEALEKAEGDIVQAIILIEENKERGWVSKIWDKGDRVAGSVRTYIKRGNKTKVKLTREGKTLVEFPATVGAIGILAALASTELAVVAGVGAVAALSNKVALEIEKPGGETKVVSFNRDKDDNNRES